MKVVILAGGSGKRLYPLSSENYPKQFLKIIDHESLLQKTIKRFEKAEFVDEVLILTNEKYKSLVQNNIDEINFSKKISILIESCRKNTAPAIAMAMTYFQKINNNDYKVLILPSDHLISPVEKFVDYLRNIESFSKLDEIITFGIKPTKPETGYGYIKVGVKKLDDYLYQVEKFVEKPSIEKAKILLLSKRYLWNSGMFLFSNECFFNELKKHSKGIFDLCSHGYDFLSDKYHLMPNISIDYALMEKSNKIAVCPMEIQWSDIGSFESLYETFPKDKKNNVKICNLNDLENNNVINGNEKLIYLLESKNISLMIENEWIFLSKNN